MDVVSAMQVKLGLTRPQALMLYFLHENRVLTIEEIEEDYRLVKNAKVMVHRLRQRLRGTRIMVNHTHGVGYWIDAKSKTLIADAMSDGEPFENPYDGGGMAPAAS